MRRVRSKARIAACVPRPGERPQLDRRRGAPARGDAQSNKKKNSKEPFHFAAHDLRPSQCATRPTRCPPQPSCQRRHRTYREEARRNRSRSRTKWSRSTRRLADGRSRGWRASRDRRNRQRQEQPRAAFCRCRRSAWSIGRDARPRTRRRREVSRTVSWPRVGRAAARRSADSTSISVRLCPPRGTGGVSGADGFRTRPHHLGPSSGASRHRHVHHRW